MRKSSRVTWFNDELKKLRGHLSKELDNIVLIKTKTMKLLKLLCSEIEYCTTDVILFKSDYLVCKHDIEYFISDLLEQECLRRLFQEGASKAKYSRSHGNVHE